MAYCLIGDYFSIFFGNAPKNDEQILIIMLFHFQEIFLVILTVPKLILTITKLLKRTRNKITTNLISKI